MKNMIYRKEKKKPAGEVINSLGRLGFFRGKSLNEQEKVSGFKHITSIKKNLNHLHLINENHKDLNHNSFFNEELSRRILFIKEDLEEVEVQLNILIERCLKMLEDDDLEI